MQCFGSLSRAGARAHCVAPEVTLHPDSGTGVSAFCPSAQAEGGPRNLVVGVHRNQPTCSSPDIVSSQCREETQTEEPAGVARGTLTSKPSVGCRIVMKVDGWFAQVGPRHAPWRRHQGTAEGRTRWLRWPGAVLATLRAPAEIGISQE